jgi:hypothetical protein
MKLKLFFLLGITSLVLSLEAQNFKFCFQTGYGFYNMSTFSQLTNQIQSGLPFESKIISNYPAYHYYQPMIILSKNNLDIGLVYLFQTTGSRISSADYSGEYEFDTKINSHSPGIILSGIIKDYNKIKIGLSMQTGWCFSTLKVNEYFRIDTIVNNEEYKYKSNSIYCEPGINCIYTLNNMGFEFNVGYFKEIVRFDYSYDGSGGGDIPVNKKFTDPDVWDGVRIGVTFWYKLNKNKTDKKQI